MLESMMEMLMDPLGALVITFFVFSIITIIALALMYLLRNEKMKKGILFFMVGWSLVLTWCNFLMKGFWTECIPFILLIGVLGIAALLFYLLSKKENKFMVARILVTISVVAGLVNCFLI